MMKLVIKHVLNWDAETNRSNCIGLFAIVLAWCLETDEQGQKSLHGHYLVHFPERRCKRLDQIVYKRGKDFSWIEASDYKQSIRYFVGNALTNVHLTKDTQHYFKKSPKCCANIPDGVSQSDTIVYS
jgi:hypothetical protein